MKNLLTFLAVGALLASGCLKPTTKTPTVTITTPDVTDFSITLPSNYAPNTTVTATVRAPKIANGSYTLNYELVTDMYGYGTSQTTNVTFMGGVATFTLSGLSGCSTVKARSIYASGGMASNVTATATVCDSSGTMNATYNNAPFNTNRVTANLYGSRLTVSGSIPVVSSSSSYNSKTIQFNVDNYTQSPKTVSFDYLNWNAGASYSSPTNSQTAIYGKITITTASPILSGSFSFTCQDSSKIAGTFSVAAP